jgi:hypothetical protein
MSPPHVLEGPIPPDGPLELLRRVETLCTTGVLRFHGGGHVGEVRLLRGQVAADQDEVNGADPLEVLLELRQGRYEIVQRLPPLPVSQGDDQRRRGSLAVHVSADLMNYCERAGLTGELRLSNGDRTAQMVYDRGELVGIRVDGSDGEDLQRVFGWEEGTFEIEARALAPSLEAELELPAAPEDSIEGDPTIPRIVQRQDPTGPQFLRVVEVALNQVLQQCESYRPPARTGPVLPPLGDARPRAWLPEDPPPPPGRSEREPTVKIVYHSSTQPGEPVPAPSRLAEGAEEEAPMSKEPTDHDAPPVSDEPLVQAPPGSAGGGTDEPPQSLLGTVAWIGVVVVLGLLTVRLLALMG